MHYHGIPAEWLTPMRMLIGCLFFLGFAALFGILGIFLMQYSYLLAIDYAGAGTALTLEQLNVVFVMVWVCLRDRRCPSLRESAGVVLAFAGVVAIATQGDITTLNMPLLGLVWGITSAFVTALYNLLPEKPLEAYGTCVVNGYGMLFGCIASSLVTRPWRFDVSLAGEEWLVFAGLVGVGTIAAYFLYIQGVKDAGPMRASLLACSEPVAGTFIGALWTGARISSWDIIGLVLILIMVFLVTQKPPEKEPAR